MKHTSRRHALQLTGAALAATAAPSIFAAKDGMKLSIAAYSFRNHFRYMKGKERKPAQPEMDMRKFIDFCKANGATGAELTSYFFPGKVDVRYFKRIRAHARRQGIAISGTAVGNNFSFEPGPAREAQMAYVKQWIDYAAVMGAPHIRIFAGRKQKGTSEERADRLVIEALEEACDYAGKKRIYLGLENHDSIATAERLIRLIKAVDSKWLGINLDSGNFRTDDPYKDFEQSIPYTVNVQLKTELKYGGKTHASDYPRLMGLLKKGGYTGWVALEYEARENPYTAIGPIMKQLNALL